MLELIPLAVIAHLLFGMWMLTNPRIFASSQLTVAEISDTTEALNIPFASRIQQETGVPLAILLVFVASTTILRGFFITVGKLLQKLTVLVTCGRVTCACNCMERWRARAVKTTTLTFTAARTTRMLMGLPSYSILMNPRFAQAFAISTNFASQYVTRCIW